MMSAYFSFTVTVSVPAAKGDWLKQFVFVCLFVSLIWAYFNINVRALLWGEWQ